MGRRQNRSKTGAWVFGLSLIGLGSVVPVQLEIAKHQAPHPQAILVLEGQTQRIYFAAQFSLAHPALPLWVSGNPEGQRLNQAIFQQAGIPGERIHYDACATDTVTNFTCTVGALKAHQVQHVYVITSDYHMPRSLAIAALVFGSRGIFVTPVAIPAPGRSPESPLRTLRDCLRSIVWICTGKTGANLHSRR